MTDLSNTTFSIFNEVLIERRASPTDPIVACTIVIADPIIQSLNDKHFTCLNHALMQELSTIGAAFYMRLFYHFATQLRRPSSGPHRFQKAIRRYLHRMAWRDHRPQTPLKNFRGAAGHPS